MTHWTRRKPRKSFPVDEASLSHFGIKRAVEFIHEHHPATLDLEQAATEACLSKYHFSRLFHRTVGMAYQDYLTRLRIEEAKILLKQTPYLSFTRIAVGVGLGSLRNFEGQFKKLTGRSPSEYRQTTEPVAKGQDPSQEEQHPAHSARHAAAAASRFNLVPNTARPIARVIKTQDPSQ